MKIDSRSYFKGLSSYNSPHGRNTTSHPPLRRPWKRIDIIQSQERTMKLLLDEMYTGLKDHLTVLGWEVETVKDAGITGKQDLEIAEHAKKNGLLLITQDQKPAELADLMDVKHVLITTATVAAMVDREITEKYPKTR
jgi:predicted nuclease of predicted toxin-antitoxin system